MPHDLTINYAHSNYNKYIAEFFKIRNSTINNIIQGALYRYAKSLQNCIDVYGNIKTRYEGIYTQGPEALKRLIKYATYINQNADGPTAEQLELLTKMCSAFDASKYSDVVALFDKTFSKQDWLQARNHFTRQPDAVYAGSANGLMYSYIKSTDKIARRSTNLGFGTYGRTRVGEEEAFTNERSAIKRQLKDSLSKYTENEKVKFAESLLNINRQALQKHIAAGNTDDPRVQALAEFLARFSNPSTQYQEIIAELHWLPTIQREASFNYDLRVATSDLVIRRNADGTIYKVYQEMRNIGPNLETYLRHNNLSDEERFELAIKLLLLTDDLHTGKLSISQTPYAHKDIKEPNILIDANGELHFIDFGFSISENFYVEHIADQGTPDYVPVSFDPNNIPEAFRAFEQHAIEQTPSYFFDDKVAALRTIYHQAHNNGILTSGIFNNLPGHMWELLCSHNISYLRAVDQTNTLKLIAAALIVYECSPDLCSKELINSLSQDLTRQEEIIGEYTQTRKIARSQDLASIQNLLLDNKVKIDYLPYAYRIRTYMDPSYLQFLLENNLLTDDSMIRLSSRLNSIIYRNKLNRPLMLAILNNRDFFAMHLKVATREELSDLFAILSSEQILGEDELLNLQVQGLAANVIVPGIINTANITEVFYRLAHKGIFTNEIVEADFLERLCDSLAFSGDEIEFQSEQAKMLIEQIITFKPHIPSNEESKTPIDKFIQKLLVVSERFLNDLHNLPIDEENPEYENIKIAFSLIIRLHIIINELETEKIDEEEFDKKFTATATVYQEEIENNKILQDLFNPKSKKLRVSPVSVTSQGIFETTVPHEKSRKTAESGQVEDDKARFRKK